MKASTVMGNHTLFGCYLQFKFHNKASVLGPMLFILYIQYMKSALTYFYIFTFFLLFIYLLTMHCSHLLKNILTAH